MRSSTKIGLIAIIGIYGNAFALEPIQGFYVGAIGTGSYTNSISITGPGINLSTNPPITTNDARSGKLKYSFGGGGGGQLGYRYEEFRIEAEGLFNYSPDDTLTLDGTKFGKYKSSKIALTNGFTFNGHTILAAGLVNLFYDVYMGTDCYIVPYIGVGVGYAYLHNTMQLFYNNNPITNSHYTDSQNLLAAQGIIGLNYFLDDFTFVGLDFRYLGTQSASIVTSNVQLSSFRYQFESINLSINSSFDC